MPRRLTVVLAGAHAALFVAWTTPLHGSPPAGARVSVPQAIASSVPVWSAAFGLTAVLLLIALLNRRWGSWAHAVAFISVASYAAASLSSSLLQRPLGSVVTAVAFLALGGCHLLAQRAYRALPVSDRKASR